MAHLSMQAFLTSIKSKFPLYFNSVRVLDIGSLDINGNNREFFENSDYVGVDLGEGKNVDVISLGHEYTSDKKFDTVITTELLEHDIFWKKTFLNCVNLLKSHGLLLFTCASFGRPEHGTARTSPDASPFTSSMNLWENYYENRTVKDFVNILDFEEFFHEYSFQYVLGDLYFYGIKKVSPFFIYSKNDDTIYVKCCDKKQNIRINIIKNNNLIYHTIFDLIEPNVEYWIKPNDSFDEIEIIEYDTLRDKIIFKNNSK